MKTEICQIDKKPYPVNEVMQSKDLKKSVLEEIKKDFPEWKDEYFISNEAANKYQHRSIEKLLKDEVGELSDLEKQVMDSIKEDTFLSENIEDEMDGKLSYGQKLADKIAEFGGSWTFIIIFMSFIFIWIGINIFIMIQKPFDPYPFILLNLILSCLAALQAPVIMMSQNRQEDKDRSRAEHDYQVNLKAELEIRLLHEKIDYLLIHQNKRMLEIQGLQSDMMEQILKKMDKK